MCIDNNIMKSDKNPVGNGEPAEYGWRFLRAAGLVTTAGFALGFIIESLTSDPTGNILSPRLSLAALMAWLSVLGMMSAKLARLSKKTGLAAGILACIVIFIYVVFHYAHLGIMTALASVGIYWFRVYTVFLLFVFLCFGIFVQTWIGDGFCREKVALVTLIVILAVIGLNICSYALFGCAQHGQEPAPLVRSTLCLFRELSTLAVAFSFAVLARSRAVYLLTRPLAIKFVLVALALVPLPFLFNSHDAFRAILPSTPYLVALLMIAPTLVRRLVKDLRWF